MCERERLFEKSFLFFIFLLSCSVCISHDALVRVASFCHLSFFASVLQHTNLLAS